MSDPTDEVLVDEIRAAYDASADAWARGPATIYRYMADALVDTAADDLAGRQVLDLGAGTGVASDALLGIGAAPIGLDLAVEMLANRRASRPPGVAGDARRLPFRDDAFGAVVAAFSLNHVPDLSRTLAECRRVLGVGGLLLASTYESGEGHPVKATVERVLERYGYQRPAWYESFRGRIADLTGDPEHLADTAHGQGLSEVSVEQVPVEAGLDDPDVAVDWRLGMPHTLPFVSGLDGETRAELRRAAIEEMTGSLPSTVRMLVLRGRAP